MCRPGLFAANTGPWHLKSDFLTSLYVMVIWPVGCSYLALNFKQKQGSRWFQCVKLKNRPKVLPPGLGIYKKKRQLRSVVWRQKLKKRSVFDPLGKDNKTDLPALHSVTTPIPKFDSFLVLSLFIGVSIYNYAEVCS